MSIEQKQQQNEMGQVQQKTQVHHHQCECQCLVSLHDHDGGDGRDDGDGDVQGLYQQHDRLHGAIHVGRSGDDLVRHLGWAVLRGDVRKKIKRTFIIVVTHVDGGLSGSVDGDFCWI